MRLLSHAAAAVCGAAVLQLLHVKLELELVVVVVAVLNLCVC